MRRTRCFLTARRRSANATARSTSTTRMKRVEVSIPPPPDEPVVATAGVVLISRAVFAAPAVPPLLSAVWAGAAALPAGDDGVDARAVAAVGGVVDVGAALTSCCALFLPSATRAKPARAAVRDAYGDTAIAGRNLPVVATRGFTQHWSSRDAAHV